MAETVGVSDGSASPSFEPAAPTTAGALRAIGYRADIDGLRALAIALVVAFHFGVPGAQGGYIGVDLFFVVSGFLIASIFEAKAPTSLAALATFYARRTRRLMPAFVVVAAVTIVAATILLLPEDYEEFGKSVRESLLFRANGYFDRVTTDYFAANAAQLPWLHTWSLSVEWQFYFAFPFVFLLLRRIPSRTARIGALAALVLVGTALSIAAAATHPAHAYFSATARFFEFALGALAATIPRPTISPTTSRTVATMGAFALLLMATTFDVGTPFPGVPGFAVCFTGFLLVVTGFAGSWFAHPALTWIGRRSYSMYLWHWPIVAFSHYVQLRSSAATIVVDLAIVVLLSDATYRFVERPFIAVSWGPLRTVATFYVLPLACAFGFHVAARHYDGMPWRLGAEAEHAHTNFKRFETRRADHCHDYLGDDLESCAFGDPGGPSQALLIGDSHARQLRAFVEVFASAAHVKLYALSGSECPAFEATADQARDGRRDVCVATTARDYALIRSGRFRTVLISEHWIGYTPETLAGLDSALSVIVAAGATPILIAPVAEDGTDTRDCFYHHVKVRRPLTEDCAIRRDNGYQVEKKRATLDLFDALKRKYPTLRVLDPQAAQCRGTACTTIIDATPIYIDTHHLSAFGATMLGREYLDRIGNPLQ